MAAIDELRNKPFATGEKLQGVTCSSCGKINEEFKTLCVFCGQRLTSHAQEIKPPSALASQAKGLGLLTGGIVLWIILGIIVLFVVCPLLVNFLISLGRAGQNYQPTASYKYVYVNRGATATANAEATLAAGGVLPTVTPTRTSTPRPPTKTPTKPPTVTPTPGPTLTPSVTPTRIPDYIQYAGEQFSDLGDLKSILGVGEGEIRDIGNCEFENGQMYVLNKTAFEVLGVFVLFNDGGWQFVSQEQIEIAVKNEEIPLLDIDERVRLSYTTDRFLVGTWRHVGGLDSSLGKAKDYCVHGAVPDLPWDDDKDTVYYFDNGLVLKYVWRDGTEIKTYVLYNSGQWVDADKVSANNLSSTEQSTAVPNSAVTPSNPVQSSPPTNCKYSANPEVFNLWGGQLGCPVGPEQVIGFGADQPMQGGYLFWREDTDGVYVIYDRNKQTAEELFAGDWSPSSDKWNEVDVCMVNKAPPPDTPPIVRGFSWLWCEKLGGPDGKLGWPLAAEQGRPNTFRTQAFENGLIWIGSTPKVYALFYNHTFLARRF